MIARFAGGPFHGEVREVESPYVRYVESPGLHADDLIDPTEVLPIIEKNYRGERIVLPFDPTPLGVVGTEKHTDLASGREWWTFWTLFTPESREHADNALDKFNIALAELRNSLGVEE